jgi:hypothetical protein
MKFDLQAPIKISLQYFAQKSPPTAWLGEGKGGKGIRETDFPSASPQFPQVNLVLAFEDEEFISYSLPHTPPSPPPPQPGIGSDVGVQMQALEIWVSDVVKIRREGSVRK